MQVLFQRLNLATVFGAWQSTSAQGTPFITLSSCLICAINNAKCTLGNDYFYSTYACLSNRLNKYTFIFCLLYGGNLFYSASAGIAILPKGLLDIISCIDGILRMFD